MKGMYFIKNKKDFINFCKTHDGYRTKSDDYGPNEGNSRFIKHPPASYPCYAYTMVSDWGLEEEEINYLYFSEIALMFGSLGGFERIHQEGEEKDKEK